MTTGAIRPTPTPMKTLLTACIWILIGILFLDTGWHRITDLQAAGRYVNPLRYANVVFWIAIIGFWAINGWTSWQRYRTDGR